MPTTRKKKAERLSDDEIDAEKKNNKHKRDEDLRNFGLKILKYLIVSAVILGVVWIIIMLCVAIYKKDWQGLKEDGIHLGQYCMVYFFGWLTKIGLLPKD